MVRQAHHERRKESSSRDCFNPVRPDASSSSAVNARLPVEASAKSGRRIRTHLKKRLTHETIFYVHVEM